MRYDFIYSDNPLFMSAYKFWLRYSLSSECEKALKDSKYDYLYCESPYYRFSESANRIFDRDLTESFHITKEEGQELFDTASILVNKIHDTKLPVSVTDALFLADGINTLNLMSGHLSKFKFNRINEFSNTLSDRDEIRKIKDIGFPEFFLRCFREAEDNLQYIKYYNALRTITAGTLANLVDGDTFDKLEKTESLTKMEIHKRQYIAAVDAINAMEINGEWEEFPEQKKFQIYLAGLNGAISSNDHYFVLQMCISFQNLINSIDKSDISEEDLKFIKHMSGSISDCLEQFDPFLYGGFSWYMLKLYDIEYEKSLDEKKYRYIKEEVLPLSRFLESEVEVSFNAAKRNFKEALTSDGIPLDLEKIYAENGIDLKETLSDIEHGLRSVNAHREHTTENRKIIESYIAELVGKKLSDDREEL